MIPLKEEDRRAGYNYRLFEIKCNKCNSINCSILQEPTNYDDEGNEIDNSGNWYVYCNDCGSWDI